MPQNLSDFDKIGAVIDQGVDSTESSSSGGNNPSLPPKPPKQKVHPGRIILGFCIFLLLLFIGLIVAMVFGLRAGSETIINFGLDPVSFKNWTINFVSFLFGGVGLVVIITLIYHLSRWLLAGKSEIVLKAKAGTKAFISFAIFVVVIVIWFFVSGYISKFQMKPMELPVEIITNPEYTYSLTSPIQIDFSAERITNSFKKAYDIVSYEWDRDEDGVVDATGEKVNLYFPHGGKNNGVFNVVLLARLQSKGGGDLITKTYSEKVSISKQEIYGEIEADVESGETPLAVKLDAESITDPHGARITSYSWDIDNDGRPDRDGVSYRHIKETFDKIGEHKVTLTVTSTDVEEDGRHEKKTFEKMIIVREPSDFIKSNLIIKAEPQAGVAPLTVNFDASQNSRNERNKIDKFEWLIGDGLAKLQGEKNVFTFKKPGIYPVILRVTYFSGQIKTEMVEVQVNNTNSAPQAVIITDPISDIRKKMVVGSAPLTVEFDGRKSADEDDNIIKFDWDFDDDGLWDEEGSLVEHKFWEIGEHEVKLRVTDADKNQSEVTVKVLVEEESSIVDFGASELSGPAPFTVDFDASGSRLPNEREIISYEWDFNSKGRGSKQQTFIDERAQTSHVFDSVGEYFVKLTLHANDGTTYEDVLKVIATHAPLKAHFTASRTSGNAPLAVSFDATGSSGDIQRAEWVFNDGSTLTDEANPYHIFQKPGKYKVTLFVYDELNNVARFDREIEVN